jgi:hypothetical protein
MEQLAAPTVGTAFIAIGIVFGVIFIVDGWRKAPKADLPFHKQPRMRALLWLLGGSGISTVATFLGGDASSALPSFLTWFCITLGVCAVGVFLVLALGIGQEFGLSYIWPMYFTFLSEGFDALIVDMKEAHQTIETGYMAEMIAAKENREVLDVIAEMTGPVAEEPVTRRRAKSKKEPQAPVDATGPRSQPTDTTV